MLQRGATERDINRVLNSPALRDVRTIRLSDAEGLFSGWADDAAQAEEFGLVEQYFLLGGDWCCTSRVNNEGRLYPVDPPRLRAAS